jgi:tetratricopeptide (TPR) repeat protein/TolB-like protein
VESAQPSPANDSPAADDRLDSWKEIAVYLKREVRTVQRWEKTEHLPVHRHQHEKLSTVYSFKSEIDVWWKERRVLFETEEDEIFTDEKPTDAGEEASADKAEGRTGLGDDSAVEQHKQVWRTALWSVSLALLVLAVAGAAIYRFWPSHSQPPEVTVLAMLPFENQGDSAQQPFVDGLAHEIKNRLEVMQPEQLAVIVLPRKYAPLPEAEIGQRFHPDYLLHGRADLRGGVVTIAVRLVQAKTGRTVWSQSYSSPLQSIAQTQQAIADHVVLEVPVDAGNKAGRASTPAPLVDPVAYESYLRGRYFWNKRSPDSLRKALSYFQTAVRNDPKYAPAYAGLADCYALLGSVPYNVEPPTAVFPLAEEAARKALALDSTLAEAHISLGYAQLVYERNYPEAGREFKRAIELQPREASAHDYYAYYLTAVGRLPEAIAEREKARRLDPTSPLFVTALGEAYYHTRQFDLTIEETRKSLELDPTYLVALVNQGRALEQKGQHEEARSAYKTVLSYVPDDPGALALLGHEYGVSGDTAKAQNVRKRLERISQTRYVPAIYFAVLWLGLGDRDQAFHWMDKALDEHCDYLVYLATDPMADPLRGDPRFAVLLQKLALRPPN